MLRAAKYRAALEQRDALVVQAVLTAALVVGLPMVVHQLDFEGSNGMTVTIPVWCLGGVLLGMISPGKMFLEPVVASVLVAAPTVYYLVHSQTVRTMPVFMYVIMAFIGVMFSLVGAYIGERIGWGYGFGLSGVLMAFGLGQFLWGQKHLHGHAEPPDAARLRAPSFAGLSLERTIQLGGVVAVVLVWQVLQIKLDFGFLGAMFDGHEVTLTEVVAVVMGALLFVWFLRFIFSGISAAERGRMIVLMTLIVVSSLFWGLYEQSYGTWVAFAERVMDRTTFGIEWTAGQTTTFGGLFVILLSPIFAWLWPRLDAIGKNPSLPAKFGWGLVFVGLAMGTLMLATQRAGDDGLVSLWWMILAYAVMVVGEMVLSPIGLSAVTTLSVPRVVGLMMGAWFLFSAFGEMIAGRFGTWAAIEPNADGTIDKVKALAVYEGVFSDMMWIGVISGAIMLAVSPLLVRLARR
mgnify:CR=1 FL=1